jgi:hypothetical protein
MAARKRSASTDKHHWNLGDLPFKRNLENTGIVDAAMPQVAGASLLGMAFDDDERWWIVSTDPAALYMVLRGGLAMPVLSGLAPETRLVAVACHAYSQALYVLDGSAPRILKVATNSMAQSVNTLQTWPLPGHPFLFGAIAIDGSSDSSPTGIAYVIGAGTRTLYRVRLSPRLKVESLPIEGPDAAHVTTIAIDESRRTLLLLDGRRWRIYEVDLDNLTSGVTLRDASIFDVVPPSDVPSGTEISDLRVYRFSDHIGPEILGEEGKVRLKDPKARMILFAVPAARRVLRLLQGSDRSDPLTTPLVGPGTDGKTSRTGDPADLLQLPINNPTRLSVSLKGRLGILDSANMLWVLTPASINVVNKARTKHDT